MSEAIKNLLIAGGTHGNELSGVQAVENWLLDSSSIKALAPSVNIKCSLVNELAITRRSRFVDEDLNRQFTLKRLSQLVGPESAHETILAQKLNAEYGPKGQSNTDFIIDIHNTTSNMGPTLIILVNDEFHQQLSRYVSQQMPEAIILVEDYQDYTEYGYFCTLAKRGVMVEVGPQPQSTLKAKAYEQTVKMTEAIVNFIERYNQGAVDELPATDAYRLVEEIRYPCKNGRKTAMIHPSLDASDFKCLTQGAPCFVDYAGNTINWEGKDTYPHFIGEAAYHHLDIAFATSTKFKW